MMELKSHATTNKGEYKYLDIKMTQSIICKGVFQSCSNSFSRIFD